MRTKYTIVDELEMRWIEAGVGPPVVLINGIPTSAELWRHVLPRVDGAELLAWEMVGYGASIPQGRDREISVARQADYLVDWMETIGLERAILVGHGLGGGVAQIAAVRTPERVSGLVLTNAISYDSWPVPLIAAMKRMHRLVARMPDVMFRGLYGLLQHRGHDTREMAREAIEIHRPYYTRTDGPAALARQARSLDTRDTLAIADQLPAIDVPAELVWGADDQFQPIAHADRLANDLDARLDRIDGGKHFVPEDHPDRVAGAIERVVRRSRELPESRRPSAR